MSYKTVVLDYAPKTKKIAAAIYELVTFLITNSAKTILVFRSSEEKSADETALAATGAKTK